MKNAIYEGIVLHKRLSPKKHQFKYWVNYFFFDLDKTDELPTIPFILSFNQKNYLTTEQVKQEFKKKFGPSSKNISSVFVLTQLSYFGFCFNPVSFYYGLAEDGQLVYILSLITNTPWGESHIDCFDFEKSKGDFRFAKNFHVSPFMPMEIDYHWSFNSPAENVKILMQNQNHGEKSNFFLASMDLKYKDLNFRNVIASLICVPLMSFKTIIGIYWQALLLYMKQVPFYTHPKKRENL